MSLVGLTWTWSLVLTLWYREPGQPEQRKDEWAGRALNLQIQGVDQGVGKDGASSAGRRFPPRSNWDRLRLYTHRDDLGALTRARK